jgi:hypothetical protein
MEEEICLVNRCTTNTILRKTKYFQTLTKRTGNILTIAGCDTCIVGFEKATIILLMGTQITIENALLYPDSTRTLLNYRDIRKNGLHIVIHDETNKGSLLITKTNGDGYDIIERIPSLPSELYYTYIKHVPHVAYKVIFQNVDAFQIWYDRLGHPSVGMMRKIIGNYTGHNLNKISKTFDFICIACATEKLILRHSPLKVHTEPLKFLEMIHGDICGPIHPTSGPFRYFMILIDASTRWSHVCLLLTRNYAFAKIMAQDIRLKASFSENQIQFIRLDNVAEFSSRASNNYCMA